jgi:hypothetical protein
MITPVFSRKLGEDLDLVETFTLVHANVMPGNFFIFNFPEGVLSSEHHAATANTMNTHLL